MNGRDLQGEKRRDAEQVTRTYAQMGLPVPNDRWGEAMAALSERVPAGTYGPFAGSPDDARNLRIVDEEDEAYFNNLIEAAPEVEQGEDA